MLPDSRVCRWPRHMLSMCMSWPRLGDRVLVNTSSLAGTGYRPRHKRWLTLDSRSRDLKES